MGKVLKEIYRNPLAAEKDVEGFILEGDAGIGFENGRLRLSSVVDPSLGQQANYVFWCPREFSGDIEIIWDFYPLEDTGLCMMFFSARGKGGKDMFDPSLSVRDGRYECYYDGDIDAYHISYFRRRYEDERCFHTCNLRKSKGLHMVAQGADPIPDAHDARSPYRIKIRHFRNMVSFYINDLFILEYLDDGFSFGPALDAGRIGFRQMSPMVAEYANLTVLAIEE